MPSGAQSMAQLTRETSMAVRTVLTIPTTPLVKGECKEHLISVKNNLEGALSQRYQKNRQLLQIRAKAALQGNDLGASAVELKKNKASQVKAILSFNEKNIYNLEVLKQERNGTSAVEVGKPADVIKQGPSGSTRSAR
jgi:hypothetical protein